MSGVSKTAQRGLTVGLLAGGGFAFLLWAAAAGPVKMLSPSGRRRQFTPADQPTSTPSIGQAPTLSDAARDLPRTLDLSWLGNLLGVAALILAVAGLVALLRLAWRRRWRRAEAPPEVTFDVLPASRVAASLREDLDAHLDAVAGGDARNGIVACWLSLETSVARAGLPRRSHETSAEFTVRVLHRLDLDPRAIGELAGLYREARFSEHPLGEDARTAARQALGALHDDLRRIGVGP